MHINVQTLQISLLRKGHSRDIQHRITSQHNRSSIFRPARFCRRLAPRSPRHPRRNPLERRRIRHRRDRKASRMRSSRSPRAATPSISAIIAASHSRFPRAISPKICSRICASTAFSSAPAGVRPPKNSPPPQRGATPTIISSSPKATRCGHAAIPSAKFQICTAALRSRSASNANGPTCPPASPIAPPAAKR